MTYQFIKVEREDHVTVFTLNRPELMNALHSPAHFELHEALDAFAADPEQWVGIVTGAGDRAFPPAMTSNTRRRAGRCAVLPAGLPDSLRVLT